MNYNGQPNIYNLGWPPGGRPKVVIAQGQT